MKLLATVTVLTAALTASARTLPDLFALTAVFPRHVTAPAFSTLSYANGTAYIGDIKFEIYSEPLILTGGRAKTRSFTSIHSSPTGQQTPYIFPHKSSHVGFTVPHSGVVPVGAKTTGWKDIGGYLEVDVGTWRGPENRWVACKVSERVLDDSYVIAWDAKGTLAKIRKCVRIKLKVESREDACA